MFIRFSLYQKLTKNINLISRALFRLIDYASTKQIMVKYLCKCSFFPYQVDTFYNGKKHL